MYTVEQITTAKTVMAVEHFLTKKFRPWSFRNWSYLNTGCTTISTKNLVDAGVLKTDDEERILNKDEATDYDKEKWKEFKEALPNYEASQDETLQEVILHFDQLPTYCTSLGGKLQNYFENPEIMTIAIEFGVVYTEIFPSGIKFHNLMNQLFVDTKLNDLDTETRERLGALVLASHCSSRNSVWVKIVGRKPRLGEAYKLRRYTTSSEEMKLAGFLGRMAERKRFPKKEEATKLLKNYAKRRHKMWVHIEYDTWYKNLLADFTGKVKEDWEASENELKILRMLNLTRVRKKVVTKEVHPFKYPSNATRLRIVSQGLGIVHEKLSALDPETNVKFGRLKQEAGFNSLTGPAKKWITALQPELPLKARDLIMRLRKTSTDIYTDHSNRGYNGYTMLGYRDTKAIVLSIGKKWYKQFSKECPDQKRALWSSLRGHYNAVGMFAHVRYVVGDVKLDSKWRRALIIEEIQSDPLKERYRGNLTVAARATLQEITKDWEYYALSATIAKARELRCTHLVMSTEEIQKARWHRTAFAPVIYETLPRRCNFSKREMEIRSIEESSNQRGGMKIKTTTVVSAEAKLWYRKVRHDADGLIGRYGKNTKSKTKNS